MFEDYIDWCKNENLKCETKGIFSKKLVKMFKPREKKLNGNTVYDVAIPADCDNVFVDSDNDGLKRKLISADHENRRLSKQLFEYEQKIKDLQKVVFDLQAKKTSKQTKSERVQQQRVNSIQTAIDKHLQKNDSSDEDDERTNQDSDDDSEIQDTDSDDDDDHSFVIDV